MKRKRILTQYLLYFLMFMFLIVAGCSSGGDGHDNTPDEPTQPLLITISGTVTTATGVPVQGVIMSAMINVEVMDIGIFQGSFATDTFSFIRTDENGQFSIKVPAAPIEFYTLVLTPSKRGYTFNPPQQAITVGLNNVTGVNFTATAVSEFSQSDLTGSWRINMIRTGAEDMWMRARITVDANGIATCDSMTDSNGTIACPAEFDLGFTMDKDGVITQTGANAVTDGGHMTMNSNKDFIAGTGTNGTSYQLMIAQKDTMPAVITGPTHYNVADVQGRNIMFHSLGVGSTVLNEWRYGNGSTSSAGVITMASETGAYVAGTTMDGVTLALAPNGVVTDLSGTLPGFEGFMSNDERTIVGTYTGARGDHNLIFFQIIAAGQAATMTGGSVNHILATVPTGVAFFWAYHDINLSRIETTFLPTILALTFDVDIMLSLGWEFSDNLGLTTIQKLAFTDLEKVNISNNGEVTILGPDGADADTARDIVFHGQLSWDGTYMIGVETKLMGAAKTPFCTMQVVTH